MRIDSKNNRILIITERFYPEDFGVNDLARGWLKMGYDVTVLTQIPSYPFGTAYKGYKNKLFQIENYEGIKVYRVLSLLGYNRSVLLKILNYLFFALYASILSLFIASKFNKVFVYQVGPLTQALPAVVSKIFFKCDVYIWTLDIWPESVYAYGFKKKAITDKVLLAFIKLIYHNCSTAFVSCRGFTEKIKKYAPHLKVLYVPQWAPDDLCFENVIRHKSLKKGFNFTFAGNIGKVQNLENVIKGFALFYKTEIQTNLNIIGEGSYLDTLKRFVKDNKINAVHFWGRRPLKEMPEWFEGSDVLIISLDNAPIFSHTIPAKFQAYLAAGKPIYGVIDGETADLIVKNRIGFVAHPSNINAIKTGFELFLNTPQAELQTMKSRMNKLLNEEFDRAMNLDRIAHEIFIAT